jgi:ribosomal protein S18 acetylase RimI-like enzyme
MSGIQPMSRELMDRAAITLERAFSTDPMFRWIFPDPSRRSKALRWLFRVPLDYGLRHGHVTQSHDGRAVTIWFPPDRPVTVGGMIRSGMLTMPFRMGFGPFAQFMGANAVMEGIHKKEVLGPHWYLLIVGVDTELQGRGAGTAVVKEGLARADETNSVCYLETSEERNLAFYERLGFVVLQSATLGRGGPTAWAMRREPQSLS